MFDNVIVGVDGRDGGADAIALTRRLAAPGAVFTFAHVYDVPMAAGRAGALALPFEVEATERLLAQETGRAALLAEPAAIRDSSVARGLHRLCEQRGADLLVVGSCHRGPLGRSFLGVGKRDAPQPGPQLLGRRAGLTPSSSLTPRHRTVARAVAGAVHRSSRDAVRRRRAGLCTLFVHYSSRPAARGSGDDLCTREITRAIREFSPKPCRASDRRLAQLWTDAQARHREHVALPVRPRSLSAPRTPAKRRAPLPRADARVGTDRQISNVEDFRRRRCSTLFSLV